MVLVTLVEVLVLVLVVVVVVVALVLVVAVLVEIVVVVVVVGTQGANEDVTMNVAQYSSDANCSLIKNRCSILIKVEKLNAESVTQCRRPCTIAVDQFVSSVASNRMWHSLSMHQSETRSSNQLVCHRCYV